MRTAEVSLTQYYTATTLDGFIADPDDSLDWLFTRDQDRDGPLNYAEFISGIGALAMGSTTYEWILGHEFSGKDPVRVEVAVRHPVLGLHAPGADGRPRRPGRVHERGRRLRARGDGRCGRREERLDRRRGRPGGAVRRCRASGRGDRLHRARHARTRQPAPRAQGRAAPRGARSQRRLRLRAGTRSCRPLAPSASRRRRPRRAARTP